MAATMPGCGAVSYTHLDVYKRQLADRLDDPAWGPQRVEEGPAEQLDVVRRWGRTPGVDDRPDVTGLGGDEEVADVEGVDAVDEGLVGLGDDGEAAVLEALDEVDLPQRPGRVQGPRLDPRNELRELLIRARTRQGGTADVVCLLYTSRCV